ncbi:MAG: peptide deformylase, partial [Methylococcaceae bacterium]|nr:peptide deformylase [Methylococcaceae bacterium]
MANISEIAQLGATVLRLPAQAVADTQSAEIQQIIETLQDTLATTQGVGL